MPASRPHPATYSVAVFNRLHLEVERIAKELGRPPVVLDPFAGTGGIHGLCQIAHTVGVELEAEWCGQSAKMVRANSTHLPIRRAGVDVVATSPAYGNRMADSYAGDAAGSYRRTYRIDLGRPLSHGNGGAMQWGDVYRILHWDVWRECVRVLRPRGYLLLNCKDHIRKGEVQQVTAWHVQALSQLGLRRVAAYSVGVRGFRFGANHGARADKETVHVFRK